MRRPVLAALAAVALLTGACSSGSTDTGSSQTFVDESPSDAPQSGAPDTGAGGAPASGTLPVTAFQEASDPTSLIDRNRSAIATVGVDGVTLLADGTGLNPPDDTLDGQRAETQKDGLHADLLVSNFANGINDFSEPIAHRMLTDPDNRKAVIDALVGYVTDQHWDGINVDLESLSDLDKAGFTAFLTELKDALPDDATLSVCLMAATNAKDYSDIGYDLPAIGATVDHVLLMAYDEHGPWEDEPGPIGSLTWQKQAVAALGTGIPHDKLDLGIAGYSYIWKPHGNDMLSVAAARKVAGSRARFDTAAGEWTATLADGSTLWWSDSRSYRMRVALAEQLGLHGVGLWVLGQSDPLV